MAVHNAIQRANELLRGLKLSFGLDSAAGGVERLGETITPIVDIFARADQCYLRAERLCFGRGTKAAAAGVRSHVQLRNPSVNYVAVVTAIQAHSETAGSVLTLHRYDPACTDLDGELNVRDGRWGATSPACQIRSQQVAVLGSAGGSLIHDYAEHAHLEVPFVIAPGIGYLIHPGQDNAHVSVSWYWYERPMLPGEFGA